MDAVSEDYAFLAQGLIDLYEAGFDARWLQAAGVSPEQFVDVVRQSITDGEVCDWVRNHVRRPDQQKAFNEFVLQHGMEDDARLRQILAMRKEQSGFAHRDDIRTFVDYIDADEKRT